MMRYIENLNENSKNKRCFKKSLTFDTSTHFMLYEINEEKFTRKKED